MTSTVRLKTFRIFSGLYARKQREDYVLFPRSYFRRTVLVPRVMVRAARVAAGTAVGAWGG